MLGELGLYKPGNHRSVHLLSDLRVRPNFVCQGDDLANDLLHALWSPNIRRGSFERGSLFDVSAALGQKGHQLPINPIDVGADLLDGAAGNDRTAACTHENSRKWVPGLTPELSRAAKRRRLE